ncbi:MAG: tRNA pseudouridine(55) synthase TruB [Acidobacteriota bacterium]
MINGMVLVAKERGISSHEVVKKVKEIFKVKKAGHFGTLDPLAEGLLLVGVGNATKFFDFFVGKNKIYTGLIKFGYATTTYDSEGKIAGEKKSINLNKIDLEPVLSPFRGKFLQYPPIYSAKKHKGIPLYKYARKDIEVEISPKEVEIFSLETEIRENDLLWFRAETSSGTYIRSLAHNVGEKTGAGAFLEKLVREGVGDFTLDDASNIEELETIKQDKGIHKSIMPIELMLPEFPAITVTYNGRRVVLNGGLLSLNDILKISSKSESENYRIFDDDGNLLAIARKDLKLHKFKPFIVFNNIF